MKTKTSRTKCPDCGREGGRCRPVGPYPVSPGPGLRIRGTDDAHPWYGGSGGCGLCGHACSTRTCGSRDADLPEICRRPCGSPLIPRPVSWWDPDDGWRYGVLCRSCAEECAARGPRRDDYAYRSPDHSAVVEDICAGDHDAAASMLEDL